MYKCKHFPYPIGYVHPELGRVILPPTKILPAAYEFIKTWKAESPGPPHYVLVKCFGRPYQKVFIDSAFEHIENKSAGNIARRYRFLPCVRELLLECGETPAVTRGGSLRLEGKAPPYNEIFTVILEATEAPTGEHGRRLVTFYPISP